MTRVIGAAAGIQTLDTRQSGTTFDEMVVRWQNLAGSGAPLPTFSTATRTAFSGAFQAMRLRDVLAVGLDAESALRTEGKYAGSEDVVRLWIVDRGEWALGDSRTDSEITVPAGAFVLRHVGRLTHFATPAHTTASVFVLPGAALAAAVGNRTVAGSARAAELRLLMAHSRMIHRTLPDLGPAGIEAARNTLIELVRAVARRRFDDQEPALGPSLVQAAKDLAADRLTDPELSAVTLARELRISLRTLQRAFAAQGESVTGHLRDRRLEAARAALIAAPDGWSIADVAAHWQFADASHFSRAFKARYARTPTEYAREQRRLRSR